MSKNFESTFVFVYGTLRKGKGNNYILKDSELLGDAITEQDFTLLTNGYYPYACKPVTNKRSTPILGEVYLVSEPEIMDRLDALEGVANDHYKKIKTRAYVPEVQDFVEVTMYIASPTTVRKNLQLREAPVFKMEMLGEKLEVSQWN